MAGPGETAAEALRRITDPTADDTVGAALDLAEDALVRQAHHPCCWLSPTR
jgi:hypothetical protein